MRIYPATLTRVFENKRDAGESGDEITFVKADLEQAIEELDLDVRDVMEIPSAYSSSRALPDEIADRGYSDIVRDESHEGPGDRYKFVR